MSGRAANTYNWWQTKTNTIKTTPTQCDVSYILMIHMDSNLHFRWTFFTRLTGKTLLASSETRKLIQTCDSNHFSNKPQVKDLPGVSGLYKEKKKTGISRSANWTAEGVHFTRPTHSKQVTESYSTGTEAAAALRTSANYDPKIFIVGKTWQK